MRRGVLIYNPAAGQGNLGPRLHGLVDDLARRGIDLQLRPTASPGHAAEIAREAVAAGASLVAVCGGDGTINEAAVALAGTPALLGVLPAGTANVLARELGIPRSLRSAARVLEEGVPLAISVGVANARRFLMMAGAGFDARVLRSFNPFLKRHLGRLAYAARCAEELARLDPFMLRIVADGKELAGTMAVAANIRLYGGDFVLAPSADPTDDLLDLVVLSGGSRLDYTRYMAGLLAGRLHAFSDVTALRARLIRIECEGVPVPVQVDGDVVLATPVDLSVEPGALSVLVPSSSPYVRA